MKLYSFDPKKQKKILCGDLIGNALFRSVSQKHFMRVVDGYGIQYQAFQELQDKQVKWIILKELESGKKWRSKVEDWANHGRAADYGHGKQVFLSMKYMSQHNSPEQLAPEPVEPEKPKEPTQEKLF